MNKDTTRSLQDIKKGIAEKKAYTHREQSIGPTLPHILGKAAIFSIKDCKVEKEVKSTLQKKGQVSVSMDMRKIAGIKILGKPALGFHQSNKDQQEGLEPESSTKRDSFPQLLIKDSAQANRNKIVMNQVA